MILAFFDEYLEFFIILFAIIIVMVLVYLIIFRPTSSNDMIEPNKIEEEPEDMTEDELNIQDDHIAIVKEDYVIGQNSNLLESIEANHNEEDLEDLATFTKLKKLEEEKKAKELEEKFKVVDDIIEKQFKNSSNPNVVYEEESSKDHFESLDPEEEIDRIVKSVIPKEKRSDKDLGKYHVTFKKENQKWYVKKEGEDLPQRELLTKTEAIAYATMKALEYNTSIVVHDEDGKISKYDF